MARVRTILRRSARQAAESTTPPTAPPTPAMPAIAVWALDEERHQIRFYGKALELSRYEYGVLRLLVQ